MTPSWRRRAARATALAAAAALGLAAWQGVAAWQAERVNQRVLAPPPVDAAVRATLGAAPGAATAPGAAPATVAASGASPSSSAVAMAASAAASAPLSAEQAHVRFAQAHRFASQGQDDAALQLYGPLHTHATLGSAARFNSANLLLRQGQALQQGERAGQALASIELAKALYREVLRGQSDHPGARYNLERAQRLVPDEVAEEEDPAAPRRAERAATTMRGYSPGLP